MPTLVLQDLPQDVYDRIQRLASMRNRSVADVAVRLLEQGLHLETPHPQSADTAPAERDPSANLARQLTRVEQLPANWDGYGAPPPNPLIVRACREWIARIAATISLAVPPISPRVVPLSSGGLQLEWRNGPRVLELEFETPEGQ
jgi:hypothetical protein